MAGDVAAMAGIALTVFLVGALSMLLIIVAVGSAWRTEARGYDGTGSLHCGGKPRTIWRLESGGSSASGNGYPRQILNRVRDR